MPSGSFLGGEWLAAGTAGSGWICVNGVNGQGAGPAFNLYWGGVKPTATFAAPGISPVTVEGLTHTVWTTTALQNAGLGYIVRWRVRGVTGVGQWVTPPSSWGNEWMPPAAAGVDFWRANVNRFVGNNCSQNIPSSSLTSLQAWWNVVNSATEKRYCLGTGVDIGIRYVLIKPGSQIVSQLDDLSHSLTIQSQIVKNMPGALNRETVRVIGNSTVNLSIKPWGTCTTPSLTVPFSWILATDFPNQGSVGAYKTFNLTFTGCPRVNLNWYVHSNNHWVNSAQGIVGMSGSFVHANPAIGNPRGIGVQLAHNGGVHGSGMLYISPNMNDPNKQVYVRTPAQGVNTPGSGANAGITHTIPLRARIIRTSPPGNPIVPGVFNASVIVVVQYP